MGAEIDLWREIILKFGQTTPELLVVFMLIRWVWPDLKGLLLGWLEARSVAAATPDPTTASVQALSVRVDAVLQSITIINASLGAFVEEVRRNNQEMAKLVGAAVGLVGDVAGSRSTAGIGHLPPVSPNAGQAGDGSAGKAARQSKPETLSGRE